ncbi:6-phosphogluconolactonase [Geminicoccus roseus]|uniref:6-phosphogluconolactonase n=1 Tax=Geminicoccus roseus TaxID=404900 RepID=UPI0004031F15|nr:6-phosphogluconolactonase [Geminicoccus roseus]
MTAQPIRHADSKALHEAVVARIGAALRAGVAGRGQAVLAVSGGKSPVPIFEALAALELPWDRVTVTLVDERLLPTDHADSNEALVRRHLLQREAAAAAFIGQRGDAASLDAAADAADQALATLPQPFDVIVLGMGEDGHTASWFPDGDRLGEALDLDGKRLVLPMVASSAAAVPERLTLTLPVVARAGLVLLPLEGAGKLRTLERAMQPGPLTEMPIRAALRHAHAEVHIAG